jgi:hypothetical protein
MIRTTRELKERPPAKECNEIDGCAREVSEMPIPSIAAGRAMAPQMINPGGRIEIWMAKATAAAPFLAGGRGSKSAIESTY